MTRTIVTVVAVLLAGSSACRPKPPASDAPTIVEVSLGDYFFHSPDTIPAGRVTFRLNVIGTDGHVMDLIRLEQGKTLKDLMAAGEGVADSAWARSVGGGVSATEGNSPSYTLALKPGRYVMLCYFGDSTHVPHFAKGMIKEVIVTKGATLAVQPPADLQIRTIDYGYTFSTPLKAGTRTIAVVNPTHQGHEMIMGRLKDGFTVEQARAHDDSTDPTGPSPWEQAGGVGDLAPGDTILMNATFKPGTYRLFCYFSVAGDSLNHYQHGMRTIITVD